jgi:hypothetical protein
MHPSAPKYSREHISIGYFTKICTNFSSLACYNSAHLVSLIQYGCAYPSAYPSVFAKLTVQGYWNKWPVQLLFRSGEVQGSNLGPETRYLHRFSVVFLTTTRKISDNILINATIVSFHILSSSFFTSLDATRFEILATSLNQDKRRSPATFSDCCFVYLYRRD